ncbi:MAG: hypothetical protein M1497_10610 [Nitrospirae bacterium]|nr:hypothetical protein [Nitrospirota bacterium]
MSGQKRGPEIPYKRENRDLSGEAWYAGLNSPLEDDARATCTLFMSYLGVGPRSRGVEYILSALEGPGNNHEKAGCLGQVMEYLANDPSEYYRRLRPRDIDYTSEHGFDHRADDFYEALGIDQKGQMEVMGIVLEISNGILKSIAGSGRLTASQSGLVFEKILDLHSESDKKVIAAAIYNFLTIPQPKPKMFGPVKLPPSSY